jgi:hypothetical protein
LPQNPNMPWKPPGAYYTELVDRARRFDPRIVPGAASSDEIARMEKVVERLEKQAAEKEANAPIKAASAAVSDLWQRAQAARQKISRLQEAELKTYQDVFAILGVPAAFYEPHTDDIPVRPPSFGSLAEYEAFTPTFSEKVAELERKAGEIGGFVASWVDMPMERQNRKLILAMAARK